MAKMLEVRRHTDNDGDVLSPEGVTAAVALGRELAAQDYAVAVSSGAQRATQTIACLLASHDGSVPDGVVVEPGIRSQREDDWRAAYERAGSGRIDDLRGADPDLVAEDGATLADGLRRILDRLSDGQRALVVGHSPTNEAAIHALTGEVVAPLGKGDGVVVVVDDAGPRVAG